MFSGRAVVGCAAENCAGEARVHARGVSRAGCAGRLRVGSMFRGRAVGSMFDHGGRAALAADKRGGLSFVIF